MTFIKLDENTIININSIDEVRWEKYGDGFQISIDARHREYILTKYFSTIKEMKVFLNKNFKMVYDL